MKRYNNFLNESSDYSKTIMIDDKEVLVGKSAEGNDYITVNADPMDVWFHARGIPGSHIVLKTDEPNDIGNYELMQKVARIAAVHSKAVKLNMKTVKVVYCYAKFVTKNKDAKPGSVSVDYDNAEIIEVEI